jgi:uncharacterized protein
MSLRSIAVVAAISLAAVAWPAMAQEPSLHDVYQAAEAGNFSQAQRMMDEVLRAHPNSAKAHYVEAELLAKQGRLPAAGTELAAAERLDPGLSFAKPEAVRGLKAQIASRGGGSAGSSGFSTVPANRVAAPLAPAPASIPWGMIIGGLLLIGLIVYAMRAMARRNAGATLMPGPGSTRYGAGAFGSPGPVGPQPYGPVGPQPYGGMPAAGGGIGSGLLGGLATGAALGAGMVAGEALAHRFTEGHHPDGAGILPIPGDQQYGPPNDMGGNDFGVSDATSWDDNSFGGVDGGGGGSDWT